MSFEFQHDNPLELRCRPHQEAIHRLLDGELTEIERERLTDHLMACRHCSQRFLEMRRTLQMISHAPAINPPADLAANIQNAVRSQAAISSTQTNHHIARTVTRPVTIRNDGLDAVLTVQERLIFSLCLLAAMLAILKIPLFESALGGLWSVILATSQLMWTYLTDIPILGTLLQITASALGGAFHILSNAYSTTFSGLTLLVNLILDLVIVLIIGLAILQARRSERATYR